MEWYLAVLKKYAEFDGRARRKEFWMFFLINFLIAVAIGVVEGAVGSPGVLGTLYSLGVLLPSIGVGIRRLHDTDRSGWWLLLSFIPVIGTIVLLVMMALEGDAAENRFGPNPIAQAAPGRTE